MEALDASAEDEVATVSDRGGVRQPGQAAHLVQVVHRVGPDLVALADRHDAELRYLQGVHQVAEQLEVARLEDLERQRGARHQDRAERKERDPRHVVTVGAHDPAQHPLMEVGH